MAYELEARMLGSLSNTQQHVLKKKDMGYGNNNFRKRENVTGFSL